MSTPEPNIALPSDEMPNGLARDAAILDSMPKPPSKARRILRALFGVKPSKEQLEYEDALDRARYLMTTRNALEEVAIGLSQLQSVVDTMAAGEDRENKKAA